MMQNPKLDRAEFVKTWVDKRWGTYAEEFKTNRDLYYQCYDDITPKEWVVELEEIDVVTGGKTSFRGDEYGKLPRLHTGKWYPYILSCSTAEPCFTKQELRAMRRRHDRQTKRFEADCAAGKAIKKRDPSNPSTDRKDFSDIWSLLRAVPLLADLHYCEERRRAVAFGFGQTLRIRNIKTGEVLTWEMLDTMAGVDFSILIKEARQALTMKRVDEEAEQEAAS